MRTKTYTTCIIILILVGVLSGCAGTSKVPDQELLKLAEVKPYPSMDSFEFEGITFGLSLKLSQPPPHTNDIPRLIDIEKTLLVNDIAIDSECNKKLEATLKNLQTGDISTIAVNDIDNESYAIKGLAQRSGHLPEPEEVRYSIETTTDLEMLSFKKELRYSSTYLQNNTFNNKTFLNSLTSIYGKPHYSSVKANGMGTYTHHWWGADETVLIGHKGYDYSNASHWKDFRGKTFAVSIHKYCSGDIVITQTMKDNFKAYRNKLLK